MGSRYAQIAYTPAVRRVQQTRGSRTHYAADETGPATNDVLTADEVAFIAARDSFYMASVSETGWPYVQHRGGPRGFLVQLAERTLGFADFRGNRQYLSVGNVLNDDRVSLILVDYAARQRLKLYGHARIVDDPPQELLSRLTVPGYRGQAERVILIDVVAYDWNCPQHLTPRYDAAHVERALAPLQARIRELESELNALRPPA